MEHYTCKKCIHLIKLFKHPSNRGSLDGSINTSANLYACTVFQNNSGIIFDQKDPGGCELHDDGLPKKSAFIADAMKVKSLLNDYPTIDQQLKYVTTSSDLCQLKHYYVRNQDYNTAAKLRDLEKHAIDNEQQLGLL